MNYYNENDPFAAAWLRELIKDNIISPGVVDERSIEDVTPNDLRNFTQCHFFAGIGIWSFALRRCGYPDDKPIWTGSCPCQPFSAAGKGGGFADERHLWPAFFWLIQNCKPLTVIGEQVASKDGLTWLDLIQSDLEGAGYAAGAVDTCAAGFGAPHIRQRLYWLAHSNDARSQGRSEPECERAIERAARESGVAGGLAVSECERAGRGAASEAGSREPRPECLRELPSAVRTDSELSRLADSARIGCGEECQDGRGRASGDRTQGIATGFSAGDTDSGLADARRECGSGRRDVRDVGSASIENEGASGERERLRNSPNDCKSDGRLADASREQHDRTRNSGAGRRNEHTNSSSLSTPGPTNGLWRDVDWLFCRDGKWRPVEPGTFPLADGGAFRNRIPELRGAGNALCLAQAEAFVEAVMEVE